MQIGIIDYNAGNPVSVMNMLKKTGVSSFISSEAKQLEKADKLILPGIGAFDPAMERLLATGLREMLDKKVKQGQTPFLGICLGMQLITAGSQEGSLPGLGWLQAHTVCLECKTAELKIPHIGWDAISIHRESKLFNGIAGGRKFYFAHSYHALCHHREDVVCTTEYGSEFVSAIEHNNIAGVQFHPEKSGKYGALFLKNFADHF